MGTKVWSAFLLIAITACGVAPHASTTNDVATDLDGAGTTANVRLYFQIGAEIHEGRCTPGLPALRTNCQAGVRKVQAVAFATELQLLTSAAVTTATAARNSRQAQYDEALEILTAFDDLTARKGNAEAAIKLLQTELAAAKTQATALLGQISAIEESLLQNPSPSLQAQRDQLKNELKSVQQKQATTSQKLGVENATLADVTDELGDYDDRPELVLALANALTALNAAKTTLAAAEKDQALAVDSLDKIKEEGLTYDIFAGADDFAKNRAHVQKFKTIFDKLLAPPPPPAALTDGSLKLDPSGTLLVHYQGAWGTICDDSITVNAAKVACKQLGLPSANASFSAGGNAALGPFFLDDVACTGTEATLASCPHAAWKTHNCGAGEVLKIVCQ